MAVIRKQRGHFLEDFKIGHVLRHKVGKTVTEGLVNAFTEFSMTTNPLHKNRRYAQAYGFRDLLLPPGLVMAVVFSQSVEDISENARANLEYVDMRFGAPVYTGDTIEAASVVLGVTPSSRDPSLGVVHVQTTGATSTARWCSRSSGRCRCGSSTATRRSRRPRPTRRRSPAPSCCRPTIRRYRTARSPPQQRRHLLRGFLRR